MDSLTKFSTDRSAEMLHGWGGDGSDGGSCGSARMDDSVSNGVTVGNCASTSTFCKGDVRPDVRLLSLIRTSSCRPLTANDSLGLPCSRWCCDMFDERSVWKGSSSTVPLISFDQNKGGKRCPDEAVFRWPHKKNPP